MPAKFVANPAKYVKALPQAEVPKASTKPSATYVCPMHPQIRRSRPRNCPICGMALEPESIAGEIGPNPEIADMTRRFWIGVVLSVPLLVLETGVHFPGLNLHHYMPPQM